VFVNYVTESDMPLSDGLNFVILTLGGQLLKEEVFVQLLT
jgi:hypothetical protein